MGYHDIIIIDDGVNEKYFNSVKIDTVKLKYNLEVNQELEILERQEAESVSLSHGTICAAIISKYAPEASLSSIKVLDSEMHLGSCKQLEAALKWCLEQEPMLISLSIGTVQSKDFDRLRMILSRLYREGFIIVAAYDNRYRYTVPASLECVIGVRRKFFVEGRYGVRTDGFETVAEACSRHELVLGNGGKYVTSSSNSYAAPYAMALIHNGLPEHFSGGIWDIWPILGGGTGESFCHFPDFLDSAAVVDLSGDEWPELFYFEAEPVEGGISGLQYVDRNRYIVILAEDTGCLQEEMAEAALMKENIKGIFCCWKDDRIREKVPFCLGNRIWQEGLYLEKYKACREKAEIEVPVVYLYGGRKKLVELLQKLKEQFLKEGYNVKTVGQFQRAYLYGFEYIDDVKNRRAILYNIYKRFDCDIILCGIGTREIIHDVEDVSFWLWEEGQESEEMETGHEVFRVSVYEDCAGIVFGQILTLFL